MNTCPMTPKSEPNHNQWFAAEVQPHEAQLRGWLRAKFPGLEDVDDLIHDVYVKVLNIRQAAPSDFTRHRASSSPLRGILPSIDCGSET